jgi:hypothetical protein
MRLHDLITVNHFPTVVAGADIAAFRQNPDGPAARDFLSGYLGFDARSNHALHSALSSLAQTQNGGAFWLNGVFGSGKSHLLGVLTLLSEGSGHEIFAASHPDCAPYLASLQPRLCVHISLDEFDGARLGLEEIFWRELARECERRGFGPLQIERNGARIEAFSLLESALKAQNLAGLVVCFDELSLFLGGREHHALQGDAAFLQFLGSHTRRSPLWVFAALQKTIDDISGLERYSLSQIRDRFTLLPLSLANLPLLVQKRLICVHDEAKTAETVENTWLQLAQKLPRLDFGPTEWRAAFPFHPATLSMLEAVTGRFFSRTRSAAIFCARAIDLESPAQTRIAPDAIWDYFRAELEAHPDLRPLEAVYTSWSESLEHIFAANDRENGLRAMKWLLLCKIAGQSPTPIHLANALDFPLEMSGDGAYDYARFLLERLRSRGAFLAVERGETSHFDRYTIDLGRRVGEMARRQIGAIMETLPPSDARIPAHVLACCRAEPLLLAELASPRSFPIWWQSAPRPLSVEVWDGQNPQLLANRAAQNREIGAGDDATLAIWPPFTPEIALDTLFGALPREARAALWIWKPRPPTRDELELARESAAASLAATDPVLADNRRGRALLEHLQKEAPAREMQVARVALRMLLEGELVMGNGAVLEASELARGENFSAWLEAIGDFAWPHLFPKFVGVAPRARLLTPSNADTMCLEILRRPASEPFFAASLERLARHIGEPLGVAKSQSGRWKIAAGKTEITDEMRDFLADGAPFSAIEAHFAKSSWGLRSEQTAILLCALLRSGEIAAFDSQNAEISPAKIGLPLRRAVHFLRPGRLPSAQNWTKIAVLMREWCGSTLGAPDFASAQNAAAVLLEWRENLAQTCDLARARSAQLRRVLGHQNGDWPRFERASAAVAIILEAIPLSGAAFEVVESAARLDFENLRDDWKVFGRFEVALGEKTAQFLAAHALLTHPHWVSPPELESARAAALETLVAGESALFDPDLSAACVDLMRQYSEKYALWHNLQHDGARWNSWKRLAQSDAARALDRLATLQNRDFGGDFRAQIETELANRCARDGNLGVGEATCSSCGLRLNERLAVRDQKELESDIESEIAPLHRALQEPTAREFLNRQNSPFCDWSGEIEALMPLLSGANLRIVEEAFAPRRLVTRDGAQLLESLRNCRGKSEMEAVFAKWLGGDDGVSDGDEIDVV